MASNVSLEYLNTVLPSKQETVLDGTNVTFYNSVNFATAPYSPLVNKVVKYGNVITITMTVALGIGLSLISASPQLAKLNIDSSLLPEAPTLAIMTFTAPNFLTRIMGNTLNPNGDIYWNLSNTTSLVAGTTGTLTFTYIK